MPKLSKTQYNDFLRPPQPGDIVEGKVVKTGLSATYVDLGSFGTGIIHGREFFEAKNQIKDLGLGQSIKAKVLNLENEQGFVELSLTKARKELVWRELQQNKEQGKVFKVQIIGANKGGLLARISGIKGFLPVSQLAQKNYPKVEGGDKNKILRELQKLVGQKLKVKILDVDPDQKKLILSEKATREEQRKKILHENYQVGDVIRGTVSGITDFGAFVKFHQGKLEGLIHISELSWDMVEHPSEVVKKGQQIKAKIIDLEGAKTFLSLKAISADEEG